MTVNHAIVVWARVNTVITMHHAILVWTRVNTVMTMHHAVVVWTRVNTVMTASCYSGLDKSEHSDGYAS